MSSERSGLDSTFRLWLSTVYQHGIEVSVTLIVSGKRVTGLLSPVQRYLDWQEEVFARALSNHGQFKIPSTELGPMSESQRESIVARWPEMEARLQESNESFPVLCIRNAEVQESSAAYNWRMPFLLIPAEHVAAFSVGGLPTANLGLGE